MLDTVLNGLPLPTVIVGRDERIFAMNGPARALLGAGVLGRHHAMALRQPDVQSVLSQALRHGTAGQARHVLPGPSQDTVHLMSITPLPDGSVLCVFEDLSQAEQMGQMRREFVANVSHELRSPLTALLGFIETLKGAARDDAAARERFLTIMEREASRMNRLIGDLLSLSRVEADERIRPSAKVDLTALLRATIATQQPLAEKAGVQFRLDVAEGDWVVPGDADQLVQVFQNLIENAVKYGGSGGRVDISVAPDALPKAQAVCVSVRDHGDGIEAVHLPRITERFYRVDDHRSREKGGTGLGLAIVKHIIQRHRGRMRVESTRGHGSTFSVILPRE